MNQAFNDWLDRFVEEKGMDLDAIFIVENQDGTHVVPYGLIVEAMKEASPGVQGMFKAAVVKDDFLNRDPYAFFRVTGEFLLSNINGGDEDDS